jgi:hypothetical protein
MSFNITEFFSKPLKTIAAYLYKNNIKKAISDIKNNKKDAVLCKTEWVQLKQKDINGIKYDYLHESRCNGKIIAILPYRRIGKDAWEYGVRSEVTLCWSLDPILSSLTGGVENNQILNTVVRELQEEAGYEAKSTDFKSLGICFGTKSVDTIYFLFSIDLSDKLQGKKSGDGTKFDQKGEFKWISDSKSINDPIFHVMVNRLGL